MAEFDFEQPVSMEKMRAFRLDRIDEQMRQDGIDCIITMRVDNVRYLTSFRPNSPNIFYYFRNAAVKEGVTALLEQRDGLMCGICNGFQALIKLGLVPYGEIIDTDETCPTLTFNTISRHQSRLVRTRIASNRSPWLAGTQVGDIYTVPISHGEGRFLCSEELVRKLADNGQIVTQYVDEHGVPGMDVDVNPNGSIWAVEGIMSPDGRVLGKMGHSERVADGLYKNVDGCYDMKLFQSAKKYFDI